MKENPKILIVDDDQGFVQALQAALQTKSCQVAIAGDRKQAEKQVSLQEPDVIILGPIAPRGDAFLFHQWLKHTSSFRYVSLMVVNAPLRNNSLEGGGLKKGCKWTPRIS